MICPCLMFRRRAKIGRPMEPGEPGGRCFRAQELAANWGPVQTWWPFHEPGKTWSDQDPRTVGL